MARRARGQTIEAIAYDMGISHQTVKNHVTSVYAKTGAECFAEALVALGWLVIPEEAMVA
jgi:DNA-binding NarL/FixJ family response regulator